MLFSFLFLFLSHQATVSCAQVAPLNFVLHQHHNNIVTPYRSLVLLYTHSCLVSGPVSTAQDSHSYNKASAEETSTTISEAIFRTEHEVISSFRALRRVSNSHPILPQDSPPSPCAKARHRHGDRNEICHGNTNRIPDCVRLPRR